MIIAIEASHAVKLPRTGVEETCWQIIENLKIQIPADTRVILFAPRRREEWKNEVFPIPEPRSKYGLPIYSHILPTDQFKNLPVNWEWKILRWPLKKLWSQLALAYELFKNPPDIFFAPGQLLPFFLPKKIKIITFIHDSAFLAEPKAYSFLGKIYLKLMNRRIVVRSDKIITSTEFNKSELLKYYKISAEKIAVAPLAYDKNIFCVGDYSPSPPLEKRGTIDSSPPLVKRGLMGEFCLTKPYFIFLGRLEEKKNTALLVAAFNKIRVQGADCQLLLVGKPGYGFAKVRFEIENSPYKDDIICLGYINSVDLPGLIRGARALVLPSRYEGFGMPILESMACGTPVIASDIPALREVGGEAAEYVNVDPAVLAVAMVRATQDQVWREQKRVAGLERAREFSWERTTHLIWGEIAKIQ